MPQKYKFCFGPWNISEGGDPYGPPTRPAQTFDWKLEAMRKMGFDAMMFHDDDVVPDIDSKSPEQIRRESKEVKKKLSDAGLVAEVVAPRLWFSPHTIDGAFTSHSSADRQYAIDRSLRCIEIARILGTGPDRSVARTRGDLLARIQERTEKHRVARHGLRQAAGSGQENPPGDRAQAE